MQKQKSCKKSKARVVQLTGMNEPKAFPDLRPAAPFTGTGARETSEIFCSVMCVSFHGRRLGHVLVVFMPLLGQLGFRTKGASQNGQETTRKLPRRRRGNDHKIAEQPLSDTEWYYDNKLSTRETETLTMQKSLNIRNLRLPLPPSRYWDTNPWTPRGGPTGPNPGPSLPHNCLSVGPRS